MSIVNQRINETIKAKGLSYRKLEDMTGISKAQIQRYANGITEKIPIPKLEALAKALNVSSAYLMGWSDKPEIKKETPPSSLDSGIIEAFANLSEEKQKQVLDYINFLGQQKESK